jgi:hypothetical protein
MIKYHFNKILHGELMKKFLFALCIVQAIYASAFEQAAPRHEDSHLVKALSAFGAGVSIEEKDGKLLLEGTPEAVQGMLDSLNNLGELRKSFLPFDTRATVVNTVPALDSWDSFFKSLGIDPEEVSSVNIQSASDKNLSLTFSGDKNKRVAQIYVEFLKEASSFFSWAASTMNTDLVEERSDSLTIHYGRLGAFLASLPEQEVAEAEEGEGKSDGSSTRRVAIPVPSMLRKIIAACSDTVVLQPIAGNPGVYTPSTISLKEGSQAIVPGCIDIVADNSGSMSGASIRTVNDQLPDLLQALTNALPAGAELKVNILTVNDTLGLHQQLTLTNGSPIPCVNKIVTTGGTELHLLKDLFMQLGHAVVIYTDGGDTNKPATAATLPEIQRARDKGDIAQVTLIGVAGAAPDYFTNVAATTGGKSYTADMSTFIQDLCQSASSLTQARSPLTLVIQGTQVTLWQQDALGLHAATQNVRAGDIVNFGGIRRTVKDYVWEIEMREEELKRLRALAGSASSTSSKY